MGNDLFYWTEELSFGHGGGGGPRQPPKQETPQLIPMRRTFLFWTWVRYYAIYDINEDVIDSMVEWCRKNCSGKYSINYQGIHIIYIYQKADAMAFKLRWL